MPGIGVRTAAVFLAETLGKTSRRRSPAGLLRRARSRHTLLRLIDPRRARLPRRQQEAQARHVPLYLCLSVLRPRLPGLLPAQTPAGETPQPGRPRPGPPSHPDPARHDPKRHPLQPPTSHETTHRRLTHHIEAPPGGRQSWWVRAAERRQGWCVVETGGRGPCRDDEWCLVVPSSWELAPMSSSTTTALSRQPLAQVFKERDRPPRQTRSAPQPVHGTVPGHHGGARGLSQPDGDMGAHHGPDRRRPGGPGGGGGPGSSVGVDHPAGAAGPGPR